jgi:hypothetical protein
VVVPSAKLRECEPSSKVKLRSGVGSFGGRRCTWTGGGILEEGTPEQIFDHPQEERTKAFLSKVL